MSNLRQRLHNIVVQAQIAGYQRRQVSGQLAERDGQERLARHRAGIKGYPRA